MILDQSLAFTVTFSPSPHAIPSCDQELITIIGKQGHVEQGRSPRFSALPCPLGTHVLQLEFPPGPLILGLLCQEVDGDVTVGDRRRVGWPVVLTQYLG